MKPKNNKQLCPTCKTGQDTFLLDNRNPFCPYLHCHNGKTCSAYDRLKIRTEEMTVIAAIVSFIAGAVFGVMIMCTCIAAGRADRENNTK